MHFKNPCKKCLVRPSCKKKCEAIKEHSEIVICSIILIMSIICFITQATITLFLYQWKPILAAIFIIFTTSILYFEAIRIIIYDRSQGDSEFDGFSLIHRVVLVIASPWIMMGTFVYSSLDYFEIVDAFIYRYNFRVVPALAATIERKKNEKKSKEKNKTRSITST